MIAGDDDDDVVIPNRLEGGWKMPTVKEVTMTWWQMQACWHYWAWNLVTMMTVVMMKLKRYSCWLTCGCWPVGFNRVWPWRDRVAGQKRLLPATTWLATGRCRLASTDIDRNWNISATILNIANVGEGWRWWRTAFDGDVVQALLVEAGEGDVDWKLWKNIIERDSVKRWRWH